jgi:cyclopropane fatty-acyl-phospholipid synthase-like methyltransferase
MNDTIDSPAGHGDRAGRTFWNSLWASKGESRVVGSGPLTYYESQFSALFDRAFKVIGETPGKRLLEIGCGDSSWLPYFAKRWGLRISGLDYSEPGCARALALTAAAGIEADIVCANLFAPPEDMLGGFDAVVSMGVVEHFDDTAGTLRALGRLLKDDGVLVTTVPNLTGLNGGLVKWLNKAVYDIHVPLDVEALTAAHEIAGLTVVECDYLMSVNFGVVSAAGLDPRKVSTRVKQLAVLGLIAASRGAWFLERTIHPFPVRRAISPYVAAIARHR